MNEHITRTKSEGKCSVSLRIQRPLRAPAACRVRRGETRLESLSPPKAASGRSAERRLYPQASVQPFPVGGVLEDSHLAGRLFSTHFLEASLLGQLFIFPTSFSSHDFLPHNVFHPCVLESGNYRPGEKPQTIANIVNAHSVSKWRKACYWLV